MAKRPEKPSGRPTPPPVEPPVAGMDRWTPDGAWHEVPFGNAPGEWPSGDQAARKAIRRYARSRGLVSGVAKWRAYRRGPQIGVYVALAEHDSQINRRRPD